MTLNLDKKGVKSIVKDFDLFFIDIWGVIHNGISLYDESVNVLSEIENLNKEYVLLTNAPRPNKTVINFLKKLGLEESKCEKVFTSGEAALKYLESDYKNLKFFHIGPERDFDLFKLFEKIFRESLVMELFWENKIDYLIDKKIRNDDFVKISFLTILRKYLSKKLRTILKKK